MNRRKVPKPQSANTTPAAADPSSLLRVPSSPRSTTIGIFMDWYDQKIVTGVAAYAAKRNWSVLFDCTQVRDWSVPDGLDGIVCLVGPHRGDVACVKKLGLPTVVLANGDSGMMDPCHRVLLADRTTGRLAGEHLLSLGFRDFLLVGRRDRSFSLDRLGGCEDAVRPKSHTVRHAWLGKGLSAPALRRPIQKALAEAPRPLAVFASSDYVAIHVMRFALEMGLQIPEEVAVIGAGNTPVLCDAAPVPLSSVEINLERLGFEGSQVLHFLLSGKRVPDPIPAIEPGGVVMRQSTNIVAVPDLAVARALRFIAENVDHVLPVASVADFAGVHLSVLEAKFRLHLRSTVVATITRSRLDRAKSLLASTDLSAKEISERCGVSSPHYFNNLFKKATGMTPLNYRKRFAAKLS